MQNYLSLLLKKLFQTKPQHLTGLTPIKLPINELWQRVQKDSNLELAFEWLCQQSDDAVDNSDVWAYLQDWKTRKAELQFALWRGEFAFKPVRIVEIRNEQGKLERREVRCAEDRLVIRAISQVLQPVLQTYLSPECAHLKGNGSLKQAVRDTQDFIAEHPESFVIKSDVKGYYAYIDHCILAEQLRTLLPNEVHLHRLIWQFMRRTTEFGGNYQDIERGIPLGASLSPLFAAVYLTPLDILSQTVKAGFYRRYMDDWVMVFAKRQDLRKAVKMQYTVLQALGVEIAQDKTFIGKVKKGFDFLGFHCSPIGMRLSQTALSRRDAKIARLYEQGASKRRIGLYLARWLGWASFIPVNVPGTICDNTSCSAGYNNPIGSDNF